MEVVLLCGSDRTAAHAVREAVSRLGETAFAGSGECVVPSSPQRLILQTDSPVTLCADRGLIVFTGGIPCGRVRVSGDFTAVSVRGNTVAEEWLRELGLPVVTCGGERDALTFSSDGGGRVCVTLQRSLRPLTGERVEPCEIPVKSGGSTACAMLSVATLLLLGVSPEGITSMLG